MRASTELIEAALSMGIRHFDTAPSYGAGGSEAVLGKVLAGIDDVTITSKIGIPRPNRTGWSHSASVVYRRYVRPLLSHFPHAKAKLLQIVHSGNVAAASSDTRQPRRLLTRDEVLSGLDETLKQLRRDRIDLYLIHEPDQFELRDAVRELFVEFQVNGRVGAFGLAWGRVGDADLTFGTVAQGRYADNLPAYAKPEQTRIFHGVLRYNQFEPREKGGAGIRIRRVLRAHPDAAVIFSASTPRQIRSIIQQSS